MQKLHNYIEKERKELQVLVEQISSEQNKLNKERKTLEEDIVKLGKLKNQKKQAENALGEINNELNKILFSVPNIPDIEVPEGIDENDNIILKEIGIKPIFNFQPKEHFDLNVDWIDFKKGVKLAKTRFSVLKNEGARLERALINSRKYRINKNRDDS